jgi:glycosyltransferase involved in cell wall biosynthesis
MIEPVNLILFTFSYPYVRGNEASFLNIEVEHLLKTFDRVAVIPEALKEQTPVDHPGVEVDTSYANLFASNGAMDLIRLSLASNLLPLGFKEKGFPRFSPTAWRRLVAFTGKAEMIRQWTLDFLKQRNLDPKDCLFYTYWLDHAAAGIGLVKPEYPEIILVSRAHGYDIYEEQYYNPPFWPCRSTVLNNTDKVYADSYAGMEYLKRRYVEFAHKFETSLLGVREPGFITRESSDKVFRIVSCSRISPEKRVDLILDGVAAVARQRPEQRFEWHHFGNGDQREELQKRADEIFPSNAKGLLPGFSDGKALMNFYRDNPIDVFVNSSITEGTSVAIMEALSCGIPILATNVGGNAEIVSEKNGMLIPVDSSPDDIADAFSKLMDDTSSSARRDGSRRKWLTEYNADVNFPEFARNLKSLRMGKTDL